MNVIELDRALRQLRLGGMAAVLETRLHQAQAEPMPPIDFLSCLITDELNRRGDRLLERRKKQAAFRAAALFERHDESCETNSFYFSPEAVTLVSPLLESLGAMVCEPPRLTERLVLLVGDVDVLTNLRYRQEAFHARKLR